jgi:hypothetical protein
MAEAALCAVWGAPIPGREKQAPAFRPLVTAGVVLAAASLIADNQVAPPPLPHVQVPAVQLTSVTDLLGDVPGILGGLESAVAADLGSAGSLGSTGLGLVGAASGVSALSGVFALPDVSTLLTTFGGDISTLLTGLADLGTLVTTYGIGPVFQHVLGAATAALGFLDVDGQPINFFQNSEPGEPLPCAFLCELTENLSAPAANASAASDVSALAGVSALPDLSTLLNPGDPGTLLATTNPLQPLLFDIGQVYGQVLGSLESTPLFQLGDAVYVTAFDFFLNAIGIDLDDVFGLTTDIGTTEAGELVSILTAEIPPLLLSLIP